ncbi:cell morphogenesis protein N-terminal, partial [Piptocephalis cylindrospora]
MLLPLAPKATAEVNYPGWAAAVETLYPKASKMVLKPKHWQVAHPLQATLLCVSRRAHFLDRWLPFIETALHPPRSGVGAAWRGGGGTGSSSRHLFQALGSVSRLVWVYLYRCQESYTASTRKLDIVVKLLFPPGR